MSLLRSALRSGMRYRWLNTVKKRTIATVNTKNTYNEQKYRKLFMAPLYLFGGLLVYYLTKKKNRKDDAFTLPIVHAEEKDKASVPIYKIVLTGGPCAGISVLC